MHLTKPVHGGYDPSIMSKIAKSKITSDDLTLIEIMRRFSTEEAAREYFENLRWPTGPVCPHCDNSDSERIYKVTPNAGKKVRAGLYKCAECGDQFTVTVGTVMEHSHIPLNKWLIAFYIMCASKTQVSALQLQCQLELGSYRSAWFLCRRIRFALMDLEPSNRPSGSVEADETYIGGKKRGHGCACAGNKSAVVSIVKREGCVRSRVVDKVTGNEIAKIPNSHVVMGTHLNTDESRLYKKVGRDFASHDVVNYFAGEYGRRDLETGRLATGNTVEGFFVGNNSSLDGTRHHINERRIGLYFEELDYKYSTRAATDGARTATGFQRMAGRCQMLRSPKAKVA